MSSFENFFAQLPIRQVNGCRYYGPRQEDAFFSPPVGSELFVARIPKHFSHKELIKILFNAGPVYDVRLMVTFMKENKGFAFVRYSNPEIANRAIGYINRHQLPASNGCLVAIPSTDHRTLMLTGCSPSVTREEVENFFINFERGDLVSVTMEVEKGRASPVFYLLFASHGSAAVVKKSNWASQINGQWGPWVYLDWQPNTEVDQRKRVKNVKRCFNLMHKNPATRPSDWQRPSKNLGVLTSTSNIMVQSSPEPMLDEASNATTFDLNSFTPLMNVNGELKNRGNSFMDTENFAPNQWSLNMDEEVSISTLRNQLAGNTQKKWTAGNSASNQSSSFFGSDGVLGALPLGSNQRDLESSQKKWTAGNSASNQNSFFGLDGAWGVPLLDSNQPESSQKKLTAGNSASIQSSFSFRPDVVWGVPPLDCSQSATGNTLKQWVFGDSSANQEAPSSESAGAWGGFSPLFQNDQKDEVPLVTDPPVVPPGARPILGRGEFQGAKTMRF